MDTYKNFGTLLENNTADSHSTVLGETVSAAKRLHVRIQHPQTVISDFELAIISAIKNEFSIESVRLCFFTYVKVFTEEYSWRAYNSSTWTQTMTVFEKLHTVCEIFFP